MARKGTLTLEISKRYPGSGIAGDDYGIESFGVRESDGKLLTRWQTFNADGSPRNNFGWKLAPKRMTATKSVEEVIDNLRSAGYD